MHLFSGPGKASQRSESIKAYDAIVCLLSCVFDLHIKEIYCLTSPSWKRQSPMRYHCIVNGIDFSFETSHYQRYKGLSGKIKRVCRIFSDVNLTIDEKGGQIESRPDGNGSDYD